MSSLDSEPSTSGAANQRQTTNDDELEPTVSKSSEDGSPNIDNRFKTTIKCIQTAFKMQTSTYRITVESSDGEISDPQVILCQAQELVRELISMKYKKLGYIKAVFNLHGCFSDNQYNEFDIIDSVVINEEKFIDAQILSARNTIASKFNTYDQDNDGQKQFIHLDVHIHCHLNNSNMYVNVPKHLNGYVVNVRSKNAPEQSFKWAVLAALHPEIDNPQENTLEEYSHEIILTDIEHPVKLHDIPKIEDMNDISFNVFITKYSHFPNKREEIEGPMYHTSRRRNKHFNLLLLHDGPYDNYCYIKDLRGLVDSNKGGSFCDGCLNFFEDVALERHQESECLRMKTVVVSDDKKVMKFVADYKKIPIVVYADFEAFLEPIKDSPTTKTTPEKETYTKNVSKHIPYNFAYYMKCSDNDDLSELRTYHGLDCASKLIQMLHSDVANVCKQTDDVSVIPVFFHNFSNYDGHFVSRVLDAVPGKVSGLGSKHNFIAMHKTLKVTNKANKQYEVQLRFLDSCNFLKGSIDDLAKNLDGDKFIEGRKYWDNEEKFKLMTQKGSFPYEYIKSIEDLEQASLPPKEEFYSSVKDSHISEEDYQRALIVWDLLGCRTIRDYSRYYSISDVLILADLFENLRRICLDAYNLDPAKYFAISGLSWDAMLQKTGIELELLTDIEMLTFLEKAKRSGIAHCTRRHAIANNKYLPDTYDENKEDSFIMYYDANNLYGWAMSQPLPYGGFEWIKNCSVEWVQSHISDNFPADSDIGYFLEVDLTYSEDLHDWHADLPFCPEKKIVPNSDGDKLLLVTDLTSKNHYILHHSYLIQCLKHGLILTKVHRILRFKQSPWLKQYIDYNTERRKAATTTIDKDFYKLMNNNIYGKTIQNEEKYFELKFIDHWFKKGLLQGGHCITGRADYHSNAVMSENLMAIQLHKTKREFKMPIYVGVSVYDLSKAHMYEFHYDFMKKQYGEKLKLLYTDTDSFIYEIITEDYYFEMLESLDERFDTSDYPEDSLFQSQQNKKRVGFFKDEMNGDVIKEFVALRPKVYMVEAKNKSIKKAAGYAKDFQKFTMDDLKRCLYNQEKIYKEMTRIKSVGYDIFTQKYRKVVFSPAYVNRHVLDNLIDTLPFGHKSLKKE